MFISIFICDFRPIDFLDEDSSLLSSFSGWPQEPNEHECMTNTGRSLEINHNGVMCDSFSRVTSNSNVTEKQAQIANTHDCCKCLQLEVELKKSKIEVLNLKKRCQNKAAEIKRLRAADQRSKSAKCSLEEMLREIKQKKWITDEGQAAMNVNRLHL